MFAGPAKFRCCTKTIGASLAEAALNHDIIDAAVFGMPHELFGEEVCVWVRAKRELTVEDVRDFCVGRIAHFKIPTRLRRVDQFPMTFTGKVRKVEIRELESIGSNPQ